MERVLAIGTALLPPVAMLKKVTMAHGPASIICAKKKTLTWSVMPIRMAIASRQTGHGFSPMVPARRMMRVWISMIGLSMPCSRAV